MPQKSHRKIESYSEEEWTELRDEFRDFARRLTEERGRFSQADFRNEGWGETLTRTLCQEFEEEGCLYRAGRSGCAWIADPDRFVPRFGSLKRMSGEYRRRLLALVETLVRTQTRQTGACSQRRIVEELNLSQRLAGQALDELVERKKLIAVGAPHGHVHTEVDWDASQNKNRNYGAGIEVGSERFDWIYKSKFLPLADELTREHGRFTRKRVRDAGYTPRVIEPLIERAVENERITEVAGFQQGEEREQRYFRSTTVSNPGSRGTRTPYLEEDKRRLRNAIRQTLEEQGPLTREELKKELSVGDTRLKEALGSLEEQGLLAHLDCQRGYGLTGQLQQSRSLRDLLDAAEDAPPPTEDPSRGNKPSGPTVELDGLTDGQKADLGTLATWVQREIASPSNITTSSPLLGWNPEEGEWRLRTRLREEGAYGKILSSARNLRKFAYGEGLIDWEEDRIHPSNLDHFAPEWKPVVEEWSERAIEANDGAQPKMLEAGVRRLATFATARGELPGSADWGAIREQLETAHEEERLSYHEFQTARRTYRLLQETDALNAPEWPNERQRLSLLPYPAVEAAANDGDWRTWLKSGEEPPTDLIGGPYGFDAWRDWSTLRTWKLNQSDKLPSREYPEFADNSTDRDPDEIFRATSHETLRQRFSCLNRLIGFIAREHPDVAIGDLEPLDLADPGLLEGFADDVRESTGIDADHPNPPFPHIVKDTLSHLKTFALFVHLQAKNRGEADVAEEARDAYHSLSDFERDVDKNLARKKDRAAIRAAYRGSDNRPGWLKLSDLVECLLKEAEEAAGGPSIEAQAKELREYNAGHLSSDSLSFERTRTWARRLRSAFLFNLLRLIPLRRGEVRRLTTSMWRSNGRSEDWPEGPWSGALEVRIPGRHMKGDSPRYEAAYIATGEVGNPKHEAGARRNLLYLWFADGGAREKLLRDSDGVLHQSPYLFPADAAMTSGGNDDLLWSGSSLRNVFSSAVLRHAERLNLDREQLELLYGATAPHVVRLLFGAFWADHQNKIIAASERLNHASVQTTIEMYVAHDARQETLEERPENDASELRKAKKRNRELQEKLDELQDRLSALNSADTQRHSSIDDRIESAVETKLEELPVTD